MFLSFNCRFVHQEPGTPQRLPSRNRYLSTFPPTDPSGRDKSNGSLAANATRAVSVLAETVAAAGEPERGLPHVEHLRSRQW